MLKYLNSFENWLFNTRCLLCHDKVNLNKNICLPCEHQLPWNYFACHWCASPLEKPASFDANHITCGQCLTHPPLFDCAHAAFSYQAPIAQCITQLKFNQNLIYSTLLSGLLFDFLHIHYQNKPFPQAIIPVPLHRKRLIERGYNQAIELAKPLAKLLKIPLFFDFCERIKPTATQTLASANARRLNLKNAFRVTKPHTLTHVAIIDDVLTTGSTATAVSEALKQSGILQVDVWAIAKTIKIQNRPSKVKK